MRKVKISKYEYECLNRERDQYEKESFEYICKYWDEVAANKKLQNENGYLKALFDKESDTQVIKYNDKLYRMASTAHCKDEAGETLDISFVCVGEVD